MFFSYKYETKQLVLLNLQQQLCRYYNNMLFLQLLKTDTLGGEVVKTIISNTTLLHQQ